jgi:hydrogenase expression/formation protein HypC
LCLAIPGCVMQIDDPKGANDKSGALLMRIGNVAFGSVQKRVNLCLVPETQVGDYVLVHAGTAICRLDETIALDTLSILATIAACEGPSL